MSVQTTTAPTDFMSTVKELPEYIHSDSDDYEVSLESNESKVSSSSDDENSSLASATSSKIKCSAVHTLERDMPQFDYSHLVRELRAKILAECSKQPGVYSQKDIVKCREDDWHLSRFLLRQKLNVDGAFEMLKKAMRFNNENLMSFIKPGDFPAEFYQVGGVFSYEPDRKGNKMLYVRVKVHRKIHEINAVLQAFLYYNIQMVDEEANGRGIVIVFDCSGAGLANADMDMLLFLVTSLLNYFPKGFSYMLVHNLPWILKPFWYIAKAWLPDEYKDLVKFSDNKTVFEYVESGNLPDFMGGTCKRDYRAAPENCTRLREAYKLWGIEAKTAKQVLQKFTDYLAPERVAQITKEFEEDERTAQN